MLCLFFFFWLSVQLLERAGKVSCVPSYLAISQTKPKSVKRWVPGHNPVLPFSPPLVLGVSEAPLQIPLLCEMLEELRRDEVLWVLSLVLFVELHGLFGFRLLTFDPTLCEVVRPHFSRSSLCFSTDLDFSAPRVSQCRPAAPQRGLNLRR